MKTIMKLAAVFAMTFSLAACNTIEGLGKDISKAGDKIEETAKDNKISLFIAEKEKATRRPRVALNLWVI